MHCPVKICALIVYSIIFYCQVYFVSERTRELQNIIIGVLLLMLFIMLDVLHNNHNGVIKLITILVQIKKKHNNGGERARGKDIK